MHRGRLSADFVLQRVSRPDSESFARFKSDRLRDRDGLDHERMIHDTVTALKFSNGLTRPGFSWLTGRL